MEDVGNQVHVRFEQGTEQVYDLVIIIAEGIVPRRAIKCSATKSSAAPWISTLRISPCRARRAMGQVMRWHNLPGGRCICLRPDNLGTTRAFLSFQQAPSGYEKLPRDEQVALLKRQFADAGWEAPRVLAALEHATDLYLDAVAR